MVTLMLMLSRFTLAITRHKHKHKPKKKEKFPFSYAYAYAYVTTVHPYTFLCFCLCHKCEPALSVKSGVSTALYDKSIKVGTLILDIMENIFKIGGNRDILRVSQERRGC